VGSIAFLYYVNFIVKHVELADTLLLALKWAATSGAPPPSR
jgi:hypothetical protein